jgi:phosphopantothenoylcysteine decarboxylase/phosphopantothenate--cysteine ligase
LVTNKNILITAGSTWVAIDKVRIISNTASGKTGLLLAKQLKKSGAKITLLLGPGDFSNSRIPGIRVVNFKYFRELKKLLSSELKKQKYSALIHAAAVADYRPEKAFNRKISSSLSNWKISLVPTEKLINGVKRIAPGLVLVGFKFEPDAGKNRLFEKGRQLLKEADLDIVVANACKNKTYQAYILDKTNGYGPFLNKFKMAAYLSKILKDRLR